MYDFQISQIEMYEFIHKMYEKKTLSSSTLKPCTLFLCQVGFEQLKIVNFEIWWIWIFKSAIVNIIEYPGTTLVKCSLNEYQNQMISWYRISATRNYSAKHLVWKVYWPDSFGMALERLLLYETFKMLMFWNFRRRKISDSISTLHQKNSELAMRFSNVYNSIRAAILHILLFPKKFWKRKEHSSWFMRILT